MRKNIGWQETTNGVKFRIRVLFDGGDRILWRRIAKSMERWEAFDPTPDHWRLLLEKTDARYRRRQAPYKDLQLIDRLARQAVGAAGTGGFPPPPSP